MLLHTPFSWQARFRDSNGTLQPSFHIFPSGIPALTTAIHGDGNKFGIYVDQGYRTCQNRPGTLDNELKDAQTFAAWVRSKLTIFSSKLITYLFSLRCCFGFAGR